MSNDNNSTGEENIAEQSTVEPETVVDSARTRPGSLLLAQRETLELSLQHVADELNLTMHYVRALESDSYDKLPGDVFVKGYIRSYARLLGLDPEQMLDIYREFTTHKLARKEEAIKRHARRRMDKNRPWIIVSGIAFVVVALVLWLLSTGDGPDTPVTEAEQGIAEPAGTIDTIPVFDVAPAEEGSAGTFASADANSAELSAGFDDRADGALVSWPGDDRLQLSFAEDSGVEIEHRGGDESHHEMHLAGEQLTIAGTAPFSIALDNAPGVTLNFNGRQIDFSRNIKLDGSVRLNIGL
ncbi:MAG: RodZ domain-containing protein [Pseudohongiella sp.]|uniref:helix-turn-helix domain-containing protein n=1 Tax=Pseudohongiella sp. TaxID=1979412 RepID=UPI00349FF935